MNSAYVVDLAFSIWNWLAQHGINTDVFTLK
jgi:hypothetical protein